MKKIKLYYDEIDTPVGPLVILSDGDKLIRIDFGVMSNVEEKIDKWVKKYIGLPIYHQQSELFHHAKEELNQYFNRERKEFSIPFKLYGTDFQKDVWTCLIHNIPYGKTKTYGDIATKIDNPKAVRAVGGAVNKNPFSIVVPCHRVIGKDGGLVGYGGGLDNKKYLLGHEDRQISILE